MAEYYTETNRVNTDFDDRYKDCKILKDNSTEEVLLETREIKKVKFSINDIYHTVQPNEEGRLDLISYKYYKNPLLWWVIAQANDIYNPLEYPKSSDVVRIPPITTLYGDSGLLL